MTRQLVLVHGRSQQGKDPDGLKREWLDALHVGLAKSELDLPIAESDVKFPYYGDTLMDLIGGQSAEEAADIVVRGDGVDAEERQFLGAVLDEVRREAGVSDSDLVALADSELVERGPLDWGWVRVVMRGIDRKIKGGSGLTIALATHDVYCYLVEKSIKADIDDGVADAFTPGVETIVVGHSLGTIVSHSLLKERGTKGGWVVPRFITVGSPLAITRIRLSIVPPRWPACVGAWFNAMDDRDVVALYPLTPKNFNVGGDHVIQNKTDVKNHTPNRHGIAGYLDDADVARTIYDALTAEGS
jgi:hypothetical protein